VVDAAVTRGFFHDTDLGGCGDKIIELTTQKKLDLAIDALRDVRRSSDNGTDAYHQAGHTLDIIGKRA